MPTTTTKKKTYPFSGHTQSEWNSLIQLIDAIRSDSMLERPSEKMPTIEDFADAGSDAKKIKKLTDTIAAWNAYNAQSMLHPSVETMVKKALGKA